MLDEHAHKGSNLFKSEELNFAFYKAKYGFNPGLNTDHHQENIFRSYIKTYQQSRCAIMSYPLILFHLL